MSDDRPSDQPDQTGPVPPVQHTRPIQSARPPQQAPGAFPPPGGQAHGAHPLPRSTAQQRPQHGGQPPMPPMSYAPGGAVAATTTAPRRGSKAAVPLAALLAAVLASGGTYLLTQDEATTPAAGSSTTVVNANPADFADAGSVNWSATASKATPSVVSITATTGQSSVTGSSGGRGSGVILDTKGNIVTNNHVVAGSNALQVTLADNRTYAATIVGTDPSTDLAVIRLTNPPKDLKPIAIGNDQKLVVGQPVMAVGNPLGLAGTVTTGIVSALNRPVETQASEDSEPGQQQPGEQQSSGTEVVTNAIQTSAPINPGNSGGALVDGSGRLIGINSSIATLSGSQGTSQSGNIGIGFAIPVTVVKNITAQLLAKGKAQHAQLGVSVRPGTVSIDGATRSGAQVQSVTAGSGAAQAGIKTGDVILAIDGEPVDSSTSLVGQVRERAPGQRTALTVVRDGKRQNVTVTLGTSPAT